MSTETITQLTIQIAKNFEEQTLRSGCGFGGTDPNIWDGLFEKVADTLREYTPDGTSAETKAFRALYAETRKVIDEELILSDRPEAGYTLQGQVANALANIARKNKTVGVEILNDLNTIYAKGNKTARFFTKEAIGKLERALTPPSAKQPVTKTKPPRL